MKRIFVGIVAGLLVATDIAALAAGTVVPTAWGRE